MNARGFDIRKDDERLEEAEAHYRRLVRTSPFGVFVADHEGRFIELNPAAEEISGRTSAELLGRHFIEIVPRDSIEEATAAYVHVMTGDGRPYEVDLPILRPDGEIRMVRLVSSPIESDGRRVGVHGIARDITAELARDAQRTLLEAALDNMTDAVSISSPERRFLYVNRAHAALLGYDHRHPPATVEEVLPDDDARRQLDEIHETLLRERRWSGRMRRRRSDGSVVVLSATVFSVFDGLGSNVLAVMRDATQEIAREQHLRRIERLASVGTLIGGVAHELNNPLTAVVGFAHLMLMDERSPEDRETLEMIAREAERAAKIVADLRLVARDTRQSYAGERAAVRLNDLVRWVVEVRRDGLDALDIRIVERLEEDLPPVWADRAQLEQMLMNLVGNAEHALSAVSDRARELVLQTRRSPLGAALHVSDNGGGIRSEHLERIFDPFFTTKAPGEGPGLGLSLAHRIVTDHGGSLRVESQRDGGAEFIVDLPAAVRSSTEAVPSPHDSTRRLALPLHVLVVDDDTPMRELLARSLRKRGHAVTEAAEGAAALSAIAEPDPRIDVIVSELRMPGLGGEKLVARVRETCPRLADRIVFITGDPGSVAAGAGSPPDLPVLQKPFQLEEFSFLVEQRGAGRPRRQGA